MNRNLIKIGLMFSFLSLSACSAFKTRTVDETAIKRTKRVAVVAFSAFIPVESSLSLDVLSGSLSTDNTSMGIAMESPEVDLMYSNLSKKIGEKADWKMLSPSKMKLMPAYLEAYKKTMEGWQNKYVSNGEYDEYRVPGIMDNQSIRTLRPNEKDKVMEGLGVDAIVTAQITVYLDKGNILKGELNTYPYSIVSFTVFEKGNPEPIWFEGSIKGEKFESIGKTKFFNLATVKDIGVRSANTAFEKINTKPELKE